MNPYECVRFSPTEFEIFDEFLRPRLANHAAELQYSLIKDFDLYREDPIRANKVQHPYFRDDHYFFFVKRAGSGPKSLLADRRIQINPDEGEWLKFGKTRQIQRGTEILGYVQIFDYVNKDKLKTGWRQHEYVPAVNNVSFQTTVVSHLFYELGLYQTAAEEYAVEEDDGEEDYVVDDGDYEEDSVEEEDGAEEDLVEEEDDSEENDAED